MLNKSNLTPKERILTIIRNRIHEDRTGKSILSDADLNSLSDDWGATKAGAEEYNKYLYLWRKFDFLRIDMQNLINTIQLDFANFEKILLLYHYRKDPKYIERILQNEYAEECKKGIYFIIENTGLDYKNTIHTYAFLSLPKNIQEDILLLDESVKWESKYLDEEEMLLKFLKDKKSLSDNEIEKLSNEIINSFYWNRVRDENKSKDISYFILSVYFAGYPIIEFAKKLADDLDIPYKDDNDLKEKISNIKGLRKKLKDVIYEEIKSGLFFEEYIPLCNENSHETYNGEATLKLKDIFDLWIKKKNRTERMFQKMIDEGELIVEEKTEKIIDFTITKKVITGNSLYSCNKNLSFISEYKKQVKSLSIYGFLFNLLTEQNFPKKYAYMLAYQSIIDKVTKIVEMKPTNSGIVYLEQIELLSADINRMLVGIEDQISEFIYDTSDGNFYIETFFAGSKINLEKIKAVKITPHKLFDKEAKRLLGFEWD